MTWIVWSLNGARHVGTPFCNRGDADRAAKERAKRTGRPYVALPCPLES